MKRQTLVSGLLSLTVVSMMTGCVDDKYDLSNIDTTSRFTVDNLTVPVNLSEIKLENVVNLDDNENISTIDGVYAISKGGSISPTEFKLDPISVNAPHIDPIKITVPSPGIVIPGIDLPAIDLPHVDMKEYDISMNGIDDALKVLHEIKTSPINIQVTLSVPSQLSSGGNKFAFQDLKLRLPWGLLINNPKYDIETGILDVSDIETDANGRVIIALAANGLNLLGTGEVKSGHLGIKGEVGIEDGSKIKLTINESVTIPSPIEIEADFEISGFSIEKFSGSIDYKMDNINIAPITLNDLPDFLNNPETNIIIANPEIIVDITNPVAKYGLEGKGSLKLNSYFKDGNPVVRTSNEFSLTDYDGDGKCRIVFATKDKPGESDLCLFTGLGYVLTRLPENPPSISLGSGLPESISVSIENLSFTGNVFDFPLGNIGSAEGDYEFNAPLGFEAGSTVIYETTENGWGGDFDKVNIKTLHLTALCSTDLPVGLKLKVVPVDKDGKEITVLEDNAAFDVSANALRQPVELKIRAKEGHTITDFDGVKFTAIVGQNSPALPGNGGTTEALGPNMYIKLEDLRVTVDGYYETDF